LIFSTVAESRKRGGSTFEECGKCVGLILPGGEECGFAVEELGEELECVVIVLCERLKAEPVDECVCVIGCGLVFERRQVLLEPARGQGIENSGEPQRDFTVACAAGFAERFPVGFFQFHQLSRRCLANGKHRGIEPVHKLFDGGGRGVGVFCVGTGLWRDYGGLCVQCQRLLAGECRQQAEEQDQRIAPSHGNGSDLEDRQAERCRMGQDGFGLDNRPERINGFLGDLSGPSGGVVTQSMSFRG